MRLLCDTTRKTRRRVSFIHEPPFDAVVAQMKCMISRCSSVVERVIGNDEVGSSILPSGTIFFTKQLCKNLSLTTMNAHHPAHITQIVEDAACSIYLQTITHGIKQILRIKHSTS